jgi:hypothetical protein
MSPRYSQHEIFRGLVVIHLETNRLRQRVRAIQKASPLIHRAKVLGRALVSARTDAKVALPSTRVFLCQVLLQVLQILLQKHRHPWSPIFTKLQQTVTY